MGYRRFVREGAGIIGRLRRPFWYGFRFPHAETRKSCPNGRFARSLVVAIIASPLRGLVGGGPAGNLRAEKKISRF